MSSKSLCEQSFAPYICSLTCGSAHIRRQPINQISTSYWQNFANFLQILRDIFRGLWWVAERLWILAINLGSSSQSFLNLRFDSFNLEENMSLQILLTKNTEMNTSRISQDKIPRLLQYDEALILYDWVLALIHYGKALKIRSVLDQSENKCWWNTHIP